VRIPSLEDEGLNLAGFVHGRPPGHGLSVVRCDLHDSAALRMCVLKERGGQRKSFCLCLEMAVAKSFSSQELFIGRSTRVMTDLSLSYCLNLRE